MRIPILTLAFASMVCAADDALRFIPATPANARLADGSPLPEDTAPLGWRWLPEEGNSGVFTSIPGADHSILMVDVDGLSAGSVYEVFGYFWADGWGLDHPKSRNHVPAQFGLGLATLHTFDGADQPTRNHVMSWEVTPRSASGKFHGLAAAIEDNSSLKLRHNESRLIRARLGRVRADADGRLPVFFSAYPYRRPAGPAWIDGVGVRKTDAEGPLEEGWKEGTWLHLAVRAGDAVTIGRELARGAEVNILDEEHLSVLFHAVVADDVALVKKLLDMGADPNLPGQSAPPLSAAATAASEDIVRLLLDAGAAVPPAGTKELGTLSQNLHPANLHPVICAIKSGSVPILEMLLEKRPDIDVVSLADVKPITPDGGKKLLKAGNISIRAAITAENWEMASWLIGAGLFERERNDLKDGKLLARCISAGEPGMAVLEGLIEAGITPVDFSSNPRSASEPDGDGRMHDAQRGWLLPQDALGAAIWAGEKQLVERFLPKASYAPLDYVERLHMIAMFTQDTEIIGLVTEHFGRITPLRWKPTAEVAETATMRDEDLRVLLPRTSAPPARPDHVPGKYVLGVIASPDAMDPGSFLSAIASGKDGWKAVDRDLLEAALLETRIAKPWLDGKHDLALFGDKLNADVLAIIDVTKGESERVYSIEMVEVATGLVVHREHLSAKSFKPEEDLPALLDRSARALDAAARSERRQAVTLLSFTARGGLPNELALASLLHASVQHKVDATSGFISLTRSQSARLVEEQALQGKNSLWGAAHLVEGSVSSAGKPGTIRVSLRLETLGADIAPTQVDAEAVGAIGNAEAVMEKAWKNLLMAVQGALGDAGRKVLERPADAVAAEEAKRLLREADWLISAHMSPKRVLALIESASALGAPHGDLIRIHLDHLFRGIPSLSCQRVGKSQTAQPFHKAFGHLRELPVAFDLADRMAHELPQARELLHQAGFYFARYRDRLPHARSRGDHHGNEFWLTINALSFMRAAIYPDLLTAEQRADYGMLGRELDAFTREYYAVLAETPDHDNGRSALLGNGHRWILKRNPELVPGMLATVHQVNSINRFFPHNSIDKHHGLTALAEGMIRTLANRHSPRVELFKADLRCYLAKDGEAPERTREFVAAAMNANRAEDYELGFSTHSTSGMVARHTPSDWFGACINGGGLLPTLVHAPRPAPEAIRKAGTYLGMHHYRRGLPRPMETRWYSIGSAEDWYDKEMQAALARKDAARLGELLDALPLHLMYSGHNHQPLLEKRYRNALRQLEAPPAAGKPVGAALLADFRGFTSSNAGASRWFMRDRVNPDLLWVFYFESIGTDMGVDRNGDFVSYHLEPSTRHRRTWLLGIDCRDGKVKTRVSLEKTALESVGCHEPPRHAGLPFMEFDQNNGSIMANIWLEHDVGRTGHRHAPRIIVIDKESGAVRSLPEGRLIARATQHNTHAGWVNVAGTGDDFYFIDQAGYGKAAKLNRRPEEGAAATVYHLGPDMKLAPLVENGRRPSISPFDGIDTIPTEVAPDGDRVLVYNGARHAHYDSASASWEIVKDHHTKFGFKMFHFAQRERNRSIGEHHRIHFKGQDTGWRIDYEKLMPGRFWCINDQLGARELAVDLEIPGEFLESVNIVTGIHERVGNGSSSRLTGCKKTKLSDYIADQPFHPVVLNQTEDHLIVGLQADSRLRWKRPSREGLHLPFLWKVSKEALLARLRE